MLLAVMLAGLFMNAAIADAFETGGWAFVIPLLVIQAGRSILMVVVAPTRMLREHYARAPAVLDHRHGAALDRGRDQRRAIVFMARTSTPWRLLPARELGCGSPATCWRRLAEWAGAGVFEQLHLEVLDRLGEHGQLDWSRASVDTMSVRAKRGGPRGRKSSRPWQAWKQAPPGLRRRRAAADRRQRQRHQHVRGGPG